MWFVCGLCVWFGWFVCVWFVCVVRMCGLCVVVVSLVVGHVCSFFNLLHLEIADFSLLLHLETVHFSTECDDKEKTPISGTFFSSIFLIFSRLCEVVPLFLWRWCCVPSLLSPCGRCCENTRTAQTTSAFLHLQFLSQQCDVVQVKTLALAFEPSEVRSLLCVSRTDILGTL